VWDRLKAARTKDWQIGDPAHDAMLLHEHYRELARTPESQKKDADYQRQLNEAEAAANQLSQALPLRDLKRVNELYSSSAKSCVNCHTTHRDNINPRP
jgi:ribosomal protein S15P/S13E